MSASEYSCENCQADDELGEAICGHCGTVLDQRMIEKNGEWRNFSESDKDNARAATVDSFSGIIGTSVAHNTRDFVGRNLAKMNNRGQASNKQRNLEEAQHQLKYVADRLGLSSRLLDEAKALYKKYEECRGQTMKTGRHLLVAAAIVYLACKEAGLGRTFNEMKDTLNVSDRELRRVTKSTEKVLNRNKQVTTATAVKPHELVERLFSFLKPKVCNQQGYSEKAAFKIQESAKIMTELASSKLEGRQPSSVASVCIFLACQLAGVHISEKDVSDAAKINSATIKSAYKELESHFKEVVPNNYLDYCAQLKQYRLKSKAVGLNASDKDVIGSMTIPACP